MNTTQTTPRLNLWPYAIVTYFVVFISCVVAFIAWSVHQNMDLVRSDYYEQEIRYQDQIERLKRTQPLNAEVNVAYDLARQRITVTLPTTHVAQAKGRIHFYRPSDAKLDRDFPLNLAADATQTLDAKLLHPGQYKVRVEWSSDGQEFFFDRSIVVGTNEPSEGRAARVPDLKNL